MLFTYCNSVHLVHLDNRPHRHRAMTCVHMEQCYYNTVSPHCYMIDCLNIIHKDNMSISQMRDNTSHNLEITNNCSPSRHVHYHSLEHDHKANEMECNESHRKTYSDSCSPISFLISLINKYEKKLQQLRYTSHKKYEKI